MPRGLTIKPFLFLLMGSFFLAACATNVPQPVTDAPQTIRENVEYRLGSGDDLRITVFGQDDLSGEYKIDGSGNISMPLIGQVKIVGLTTAGVESRISEALEGDYLRNPKVSAEVTNYRPYTILGEVRAPGQFPYRSGLTVIEAVAQAGGFTYRANEKVVLIKSKDSSQELTVALDGNTLVQPGDSIRIKERFF